MKINILIELCGGPGCRSPTSCFRFCQKPEKRRQEDEQMAQYKTVPYEKVEHTEIARKAYLEFEREQDAPDVEEAEATWIADKKRLRNALDTLPPRQRQAYVLRVGYRLSEDEIARRMGITQSGVAKAINRAKESLTRFAATDIGE